MTGDDFDQIGDYQWDMAGGDLTDPPDILETHMPSLEPGPGWTIEGGPTVTPLTDDELREIEEQRRKATSWPNKVAANHRDRLFLADEHGQPILRGQQPCGSQHPYLAQVLDNNSEMAEFLAASFQNVPRLVQEVRRLREESIWVRKKLGLHEDTPFVDGNGPTLTGSMHVVCSHAHGYESYIVAYKCDDKQGEIARLTVERNELREQVKAEREACAQIAENLQCEPGVEMFRFVNREHVEVGRTIAIAIRSRASQETP
jgi:hypothetical protein